MFVVLTPEQSREASRLTFGGRDRLILSKATVLADRGTLRLESENAGDLTLAIYPPVKSLNSGFDLSSPEAGEWIFRNLFGHITPKHSPEGSKPVNIDVSQVKAAGTNVVPLSGTNEATWDGAAIYKLGIPKIDSSRKVILRIHYIGDIARLYVGDKLYDDNYYNGDPFDIALWRIPVEERANIQLKILPYSDALSSRLPAQAKEAIASAKATSTLDKVTITAADQLEATISPK
jgi:hypothetical protein